MATQNPGYFKYPSWKYIVIVTVITFFHQGFCEYKLLFTREQPSRLVEKSLQSQI